jgi:hypothetical protein
MMSGVLTCGVYLRGGINVSGWIASVPGTIVNDGTRIDAF